MTCGHVTDNALGHPGMTNRAKLRASLPCRVVSSNIQYKNIGIFSNYDQMGYKKSADGKNSPELGGLERDLIIIIF